MLVGIGCNQPRIDRKPFAATRPNRNAYLDDPLEYAAKDLSLTEALVAAIVTSALTFGRRTRPWLLP